MLGASSEEMQQEEREDGLDVPRMSSGIVFNLVGGKGAVPLPASPFPMKIVRRPIHSSGGGRALLLFRKQAP